MTMSELMTKRVELNSGGYRLSGELNDPGGKAPLVVLCHGIPISRPDPSDPGYPAFARELAGHGYATLFVNFRGTGSSEGDFCMGGWYEDVEATMRRARELASGRGGIFMAGFSAGAALAIHYAAEHKGIDGVAAFAAAARLTEVFPRKNILTYLEMAREVGIIRQMQFPPSPDWFYEDLERNDAVRFVPAVSPIPLLIVHGDADETVSVEQGRALFEAAGEPKGLRILPGGSHRLRRDPRSLECLLDWLRKPR